MRDSQDGEDERSSDAPLVVEPQSFGTWLRRQREVREIDLREIADSTKVSMSYLRAFEEDRFDVLPASVFAKGFLRQYARYVGLDPEEVVNFYLAARQPEDEPSLLPRSEPEPPARNYLFFVLAVTAALVLLVWLLSVFGDRARPSAPVSAPVTAPAPESSLAGDRREAAAAEIEAASTPDESRRRRADETESRRRRADETESRPRRADETESRPRRADGTAAIQPVEPDPVQAAEEPRPPLRVTLDFLSDCWVEASVDGAKRLSELKVQGESLLLDAEEAVEFKVGDVAAVQVEVNGLPFEIESRSGTSVRSVRIDLATAAAVAAAGTSPSSEGAVEE